MRDPRLSPEIGDLLTQSNQVWEIVQVSKLNMYEFPKRVLLQSHPLNKQSKALSLTLVEYRIWAERARPILKPEVKKDEEEG